jgi:hypothetical protein
MPLDNRDEFIQSIAAERTFLEVGGLWGEVNEKATVAFKAGARDVGALDIWKDDSEWWAKFRARCAECGMPAATEFVGSIDNIEMLSRVGDWDVVHCSGVLYHCPNPFLTLSHLRALTREYLLLTVAVMPPAIENEQGRIELSPDSALLVPCLTPEKRRVVDHYISKMYGGVAYGVNTPISDWFFSDDKPNYGPWWWLWTAEYVARMVSVCGFEIERAASQFNGTGHLFMLRKVPLQHVNYSKF